MLVRISVKKMLCYVIHLFIILFASLAVAETETCTHSEEISALDSANIAQSWKHLHQLYKLYGHCDDGAIGEGFSGSVGRLLTKKWGTINQLGKIGTLDPAFQTFVIEHIDETLLEHTLKLIEKNANTKCPTRHTSLCHQIRTKALKAYSEQK